MEALRTHKLGVRRASDEMQAAPTLNERSTSIVILRRAYFARRRTWASRAKGRVFCDPQIARLARIPIELLH